MLHRARVAIITAAAVLLTGCTAVKPNDYPAEYRAARSAPAAAVSVPQERIDAFVALLTTLDADDWEQRTRAVYAAELHFNDTLTTARDIDALVRHFGRIRNNAVRLEVHATLIDGPDVYLVWSMTTDLDDLRSGLQSDSIGATHLRYDATERIVLHQDFWDSTQGFYQHVPVIGRVIRRIGKRFEAED